MLDGTAIGDVSTIGLMRHEARGHTKTSGYSGQVLGKLDKKVRYAASPVCLLGWRMLCGHCKPVNELSPHPKCLGYGRVARFEVFAPY